MHPHTKVVHLAHGNLSGGAAKGAYILHKGLLSAGVESRMLITTAPVNSTPQGVHILGDSTVKRFALSLLNRAERQLRRDLKMRRVGLYTAGLMGSWVRKHPMVQSADLINLHWVNAGMLSVGGIGRMRKPIVWTLRDMWPFTGGCHYSLDCRNYERGCGRCPLFGSKRQWDRTAWNFRRKIRSFRRLRELHPIGISPWIADEASKSAIFQDREVRYIWNGIDRSCFPFLDQAKARRLLGLDPGARYVAVGANNVWSEYKGHGLFLEALRILPDLLGSRGLRLLVFGKGGQSLAGLLPNSVDYGFVGEDRLLNQIYAASDCFVLPSKQEAFGKTVAEALSSGTPVVCFDVCGPRDMIQNERNGFKAKAFDVHDLAACILRTSASTNLLERCEISRTAAAYCHLRAGREYAGLYGQIA